MFRTVCITGATGYLGRALSAALTERGHAVRALVRPGGAARAAPGGEVRELDVFDVDALSAAFGAGETVVHLIGTPHPDPSKAAEFERVDLGSARICATAAARAGVAHLVYVSVAQPAPMMRAYVEARAAAETAIASVGLSATFVRPWYVLGPGHRWPYLLLPFYRLAELVPSTRDSARRLGLVTLAQMTRALVVAAENPPPVGERRIVDVPAIRAAGTGAA
jgi:uncharacterized protein YbjT (DUF2867 family)